MLLTDVKTEYTIKEKDRVRVKGREDLGIVEVYRVSDAFGVWQAEVDLRRCYGPSSANISN